MRKKIFFLSPGCYDRGGISRYNRYQIDAIRSFSGAILTPYSFRGPDYNPLDTTVNGVIACCLKEPNKTQKLLFALSFLSDLWIQQPDIVILAHINFNIILPLIKLLCPRSKVFLNIYGLEVWSSKNRVTKCFKYLLAGVISDCNNTANYFRMHMSYKSKLITIWDCVDHRVFYPDSDDTLESFPYVLSMGRLSWGAAHKGYIRLIDAFSELVKYSPHIKLIIAGDGDMKNHLVKYCRTILPPDSVYFPGYVTDRVYRKLLTNARVFSLVSESGQNAGEGLPLTPLEAMACGTPIVVGDQDGSKEAIQAKIGFAINPFDRSAHIKSLSYYLDMHPSEYLQLSALCRETSLKYFSYEQFSDKLYDALYY